MKFKYKDQIVIASSKDDAIKIISNSKTVLNETEQDDIFNRAINGDKSILKLPKEALMIKDKRFGNTPVHDLAWAGVKEILKLPKELLMIQNKHGQTPIHRLALDRVKEILNLSKELLSIKNVWGKTPITILSDRGIEIPEKFMDLI
jgi:hypothetical protein